MELDLKWSWNTTTLIWMRVSYIEDRTEQNWSPYSGILYHFYHLARSSLHASICIKSRPALFSERCDSLIAHACTQPTWIHMHASVTWILIAGDSWNYSMQISIERNCFESNRCGIVELSEVELCWLDMEQKSSFEIIVNWIPVIYEDLYLNVTWCELNRNQIVLWLKYSILCCPCQGIIQQQVKLTLLHWHEFQKVFCYLYFLC